MPFYAFYAFRFLIFSVTYPTNLLVEVYFDMAFSPVVWIHDVFGLPLLLFWRYPVQHLLGHYTPSFWHYTCPIQYNYIRWISSNVVVFALFISGILSFRLLWILEKPADRLQKSVTIVNGIIFKLFTQLPGFTVITILYCSVFRCL